MRKIPKKNYILLLLIVVITIILTLSLASFYKNRHSTTSTLYTFLSEVTPKDFETYLSENEVVAVYLDDKYDLSNTKEQEKLRKKIIKLNLNESFVFLDINSLDDEFKKDFTKEYNYTISDNYPVIIIIKNQEVIKVYNKLNVDDFNFEVLQ